MNKLKRVPMCKLVKEDEFREAPGAYMKLCLDATHVCLKCGRVSSKKKRLCKPQKLDD